MTFLDSFLLRAALAGLGVALAAAPLGCFVVWRRMAYFSDATAHAALLGVALSFALTLPIGLGVLILAFAMALGITALGTRGFAADTSLGVMSHTALAAGLVAISLIPGIRIDPETYLFGDILAVGQTDLWIIWSAGALVVGLIWWRWSALLTVTLNPDLAEAAGLKPAREELILTLALALVVAVSIKIVGALLIGALLIIPAASARPLARTPEIMAAIAAIIGAGSALGGLQISYLLDTPTGPTIVCTAAGLFLLTSLLAGLMRRA